MRRYTGGGLLIACFVFLAACGDSTGLDFNPLLVQDTVLIAAPLAQNADLPTALDITGNGGGGVWGGRFPELPRDALEWDFALRIRDGQLVLLPARLIGVPGARSAITQALSGETFEGLREVPGQSALSAENAVPLRAGAVYAARSRETVGGFFGACVQFAKLSPLEVDVAQGRARIQIVTNERCGDPRLVPE